MKTKNLRITSAFLALTMTAALALSKPMDVKAEESTNQVITINSNDQELNDSVGITENTEGLVEITNIKTYYMYTVQKGDNASLISKRICRKFNVTPTTKYWPVIAFLNNYPRVIRPGDVIYYPTSIEEMDSLLSMLKESGWLKNYIRLNRIYKRNDGVLTLGEIIDDIYGHGASKNPELVNAYLKIIGCEGMFDANSVIFDGNIEKPNYDLYFMVTEAIPTREEIQESILDSKEKSR